MRRRLFLTLMVLNLVFICGCWAVGLGTSDAWVAALDARRSCESRIEQVMEERSDVATAFADRAVVSGEVVRVEFSWHDLEGGSHQDTGTCRVSFEKESASIEQVTTP